MKLSINGKQEEMAHDLTIQELLIHKKVQTPEMVSVELNGVILKRSEFETVRVSVSMTPCSLTMNRGFVT
jgi:sulfur carrier protein